MALDELATPGPETQETLRRITACAQLPTLPTVAMRILELTRDASASLSSIAECVELDQALAAKILRTINSSFYGLSSPCPNIARAINYLGMNTVRSLVLSFSLVETFRNPDGAEGFDLRAHWRRAVYGAVAARLLASRLVGCDPDEAFLAALLRDIGSLAASIALGDGYARVVSGAGAHADLARAEREELGVDHAAIGAELARSWRLPKELADAVRLHHARSGESASNLTRAAIMASLAADALSERSEERGPAIGGLSTLAHRWLRMSGGEVETLLEELKPKTLSLARLFDLDTGAPPNVGTILAEAEEQKFLIQVEQEREATRLRESHARLEIERFTDGLTGAMNRAAFDRDLDAAFDAARAGATPLAVAFVDADKFKAVNDTHGHQAGDAVLVELAARMKQAIADRGTVYRYGGEEFAVLLPGATAEDATDAAERLRAVIAATPVDVRDAAEIDVLPVTVSVGVAIQDERTGAEFAEPAQLLRAADEAVYRAKQSGRNRTVLHEPGSAAEPPPPREPGIDAALRVLIVDDDALHQKLLATALERTGRASVRAVESVAQAVKLLHFGERVEGGPFRPDLIITDFRMPEHSGEKLVRFVRATPSLALIPVLVLSGSEHNDDVRRCLAAGASAYVPKSALSRDPFSAAAKLLDFWELVTRAA